jgi:hypothetical protein
METKPDGAERGPTVRTSLHLPGTSNHNNNNYRSLIALSLIMALLQSKPAPMYILDEIDAALDLFHTQHALPHPLSQRTVHHRLAQGGPLHQRQRSLLHAVPRWH